MDDDYQVMEKAMDAMFTVADKSSELASSAWRNAQRAVGATCNEDKKKLKPKKVVPLADTSRSKIQNASTGSR